MASQSIPTILDFAKNDESTMGQVN